MSFVILGFLTGLSLILAIGAQNIFVIEQGLKKQFVFLVCFICAFSDLILIFLGIFLFHYFNNFFSPIIELLLNILLFIFLLYFIFTRASLKKDTIKLKIKKDKTSIYDIVFRTLGFTYLNVHVYSDTVFFLGNFSKSFLLEQKYYFGIGASLASFLFFFTIGYLSKFLSNYLKNNKVWKIINFFIISFLCLILVFVLIEILNFNI